MRRGTRKKCVCMGVLLCLSINLLAGCKEKTVDYSMEGTEESTQGENGISNTVGRGKQGLKQFADESEWFSHEDGGWSAENAKGEKVNITVHVPEVTVPDAEEMFVAEVHEPEFDAAYKKQMSERIFGDGEIYYNDLAHLPRKDIEERREQCQAVYQLAQQQEKGEIELSYGDIEHLPERYQFDPENKEGWKDILEQGLLGYDNAMETAGDVYTPVSEYDVDEYLGTYSGIAYELSFSESDNVRIMDDGPYVVGEKCLDGCFINCRRKEILFQAKDIYQVCPETVKEVEGLYYKGLDIFTENQCSLSAKEAEKQARSFVDELKLDYSVYSNYKSLGWWKGTFASASSANYFLNGYIFYFDAGVDTVSFTQFGTQQTDRNFIKLKKETEEPQYYLKAQIEVYVNDKGVIGMRAYNPVETVSISEGVDLLPLDAVKGIIKKQLTDYFKDFRFKVGTLDGEKYIQFNWLELIYFRVRNKEYAGYYSYIPVWRLSGGFQYPRYLENPVLINAIDGSVLDFYDEA